MKDPISITFKWSDLFVVDSLQNFIAELRYIQITDIQIDADFQQTVINGIKTYSSSTPLEKQFELVPGEVNIGKDRTFNFSKTRMFELSNFQNILKFIEIHCSYIKDFIQEQNITTVNLCVSKNIRHSNDKEGIIIKLNDYQLTKSWLEREDNHEMISPFILAAVIQNFYQQNKSVFNIESLPVVSRIKSNIQHVNSLINGNINLLKDYKIKPEIDICVKNGRNFEFLNNIIFQTQNFNTYEQNMDIKFLSYISCSDLKEKAILAEPKPEVVEFGESFPKNIMKGE